MTLTRSASCHWSRWLGMFENTSGSGLHTSTSARAIFTSFNHETLGTANLVFRSTPRPARTAEAKAGVYSLSARVLRGMLKT